MNYESGSGFAGLVHRPMNRFTSLGTATTYDYDRNLSMITVEAKVFLEEIKQNIYMIDLFDLIKNLPNDKFPGYRVYGFGRIKISGNGVKHATLNVNDYIIHDKVIENDYLVIGEERDHFPVIPLSYGKIRFYIVSDSPPIVHIELKLIKNRYYHPDQFLSANFEYNGKKYHMSGTKMIRLLN